MSNNEASIKGFKILADLLQDYMKIAEPENILKAHKVAAEHLIGEIRKRTRPRGKSKVHMLDVMAYEQNKKDVTTIIGWSAEKFYGRFVESGHRAGGMFAKTKIIVPAQPHVKPELDRNRNKMMDLMANELLKGR